MVVVVMFSNNMDYFVILLKMKKQKIEERYCVLYNSKFKREFEMHIKEKNHIVRSKIHEVLSNLHKHSIGTCYFNKFIIIYVFICIYFHF